MVDANLTFGTALLEAVAQHRPTFINVGTAWQNYEGITGRANCLYAATKNAFHEILAFYADAHQLNAATLQLSDVYGPEDHRKKLFWYLAQAASTGEALKLSPGEQLLDLLHVSDAVAALQAVATHLQARGGTTVQQFAASSGSLHTLRTVVDLFQEALGRPVPASWGSRPYRAREIMRPTIPLPPPPGWSAKVTLATGLRDLVSKELP
jgi:nucleoside-diphosphate-sugar epimerase